MSIAVPSTHVVRAWGIIQKLEEIHNIMMFKIMMQYHYCMAITSLQAFHQGMKNWARYSNVADAPCRVLIHFNLLFIKGGGCRW